MTNIPFYRQIIFKIFILVCLILFGALGSNLVTTNKMIDKMIEKKLVTDFNSAHNMTENFINLIAQTSQMLAREIVEYHLDSHSIDKLRPNILSDILSNEKSKVSADSIILLGADGYILAQAGSKYKVGDSLKYTDIVKQTLKTQKQTTKIAREKETFIIYSSSIIKDKSKLKGLLLIGYFINDTLLENIKNNTNLELAFIGNSAVMSSTKWGTSKNIDTMPISYLDHQNLLNNQKKFKEILYKNKTYIVSAKKLNNIESLVSGSILFGFNYDEIKQERSDLFNKKINLLYITIFIALLLIYLVIKKYLNAIEKLTKAINHISKNKNYETIAISTQDEFELLANSFNNMGNKLNILHSGMHLEIENKTRELLELNNNLEERIILEVNKNREKDKQLMKQSRLAQMGEMISMIAHQWRQPLSAISSTSVGMKIKAELGKLDKDTAIELSEKISRYTQHLSTTIDDFREFFKSDKEEKETTYTELIDDVLNIVEESIANKNIELIQELNSKKTFNTYPNEIKQVILNLIKNAEDILVEKNIADPQITIKTLNNTLSVSDNAGGIPKNIIDKIFNPYFSTKMQKDGTGLGLYMSKVIIEEHCDGKLSVSNSDNGAIFKIILGADNE